MSGRTASREGVGAYIYHGSQPAVKPHALLVDNGWLGDTRRAQGTCCASSDKGINTSRGHWSPTHTLILPVTLLLLHPGADYSDSSEDDLQTLEDAHSDPVASTFSFYILIRHHSEHAKCNQTPLQARHIGKVQTWTRPTEARISNLGISLPHENPPSRRTRASPGTTMPRRGARCGTTLRLIYSWPHPT